MATQESTWLMQLIKYLHQRVDYAVPLYYDNQSAVSLVENPVFYARTKHVEVHYHFINKNVLQDKVEMRYVKTRVPPTTQYGSNDESWYWEGLLKTQHQFHDPIQVQ